MRAHADLVLCARACSQDCLRGCGGGACILRGLVQCQRALSATLFPDKAVVKGLTPAGHGCWGERAAAALQTYSPAGGGYLSHLVHSSGWWILSTTTHREGHFWPYHSICTAVYQHTHTHKTNNLSWRVKKKKNISKLAAQPCQSWNWILQGEKKALTHQIWERKWIYIFIMNWTARNRYTSAALNKRENACRVLQGNEWLALFVYASVMLLWPFLFMRAKLWAHPWLLFTR